jgi:hypothetical protein
MAGCRECGDEPSDSCTTELVLKGKIKLLFQLGHCRYLCAYKADKEIY